MKIYYEHLQPYSLNIYGARGRCFALFFRGNHTGCHTPVNQTTRDTLMFFIKAPERKLHHSYFCLTLESRYLSPFLIASFMDLSAI